MTLPGRSNAKPYREQFFAAARHLYRTMKYLVFVYVVGSALAIVALSLTTGLGSANFNLAFVLSAYGIAALAAAIFVYAFVELVILACCAWGEWLCGQEQKGEPQ